MTKAGRNAEMAIGEDLRAAFADLSVTAPNESALAEAAAAAGLLDVAVGTTDSPVGRLVIAVTDEGVAACSYASEESVLERLAARVSPRVLRAPRRVDPIRRELDEYFSGRRVDFDLPVDLRLAAPFGQQVLRGVASVRYGHTTTYGQLAARLGKPTAARAVGHALGANPVCIITPCHRVVAANGRLTGYAGGLEAKRFLLTHEREHAGRP